MALWTASISAAGWIATMMERRRGRSGPLARALAAAVVVALLATALLTIAILYLLIRKAAVDPVVAAVLLATGATIVAIVVIAGLSRLHRRVMEAEHRYLASKERFQSPDDCVHGRTKRSGPRRP